MRINEFKKENIIDLRKKEEYEKKHIVGSRNINYMNLLINPSNYLNYEEKYLLVCDKGIQSKDVSNILQKKGFHTYSLDGGIKKNKKMLAKDW